MIVRRPSLLASFNFAFEGVIHVLRTQRNMRIHFAVAGGVLVAAVALGVSRMVQDAEAAGLGGGEDYELLLAAPDPAGVEEAFRAAALRVPLRVGRCTDDPTERRLRDQPLPLLGWEHAW